MGKFKASAVTPTPKTALALEASFGIAPPELRHGRWVTPAHVYAFCSHPVSRVGGISVNEGSRTDRPLHGSLHHIENRMTVRTLQFVCLSTTCSSRFRIGFVPPQVSKGFGSGNREENQEEGGPPSESFRVPPSESF